jgi:hypothetical protein
MLGPIPRCLPWCSYPFLPRRHRPSLPRDQLGSAQRSVQRLRYGAHFGVISHSLMFRPADLLTIQVAPTAVFPLGSRGFLRPSRTYVVTFIGIGYANRPNRAIDGVGTYTPLDSRPCRPLPRGPGARKPLTRSRTPSCAACPGRAWPCHALRRAAWARSRCRHVTPGSSQGVCRVALMRGQRSNAF